MFKHPEPTKWEHCCSCCPILEKEIKELKKTIQQMKDNQERSYFVQG